MKYVSSNHWVEGRITLVPFTILGSKRFVLGFRKDQEINFITLGKMTAPVKINQLINANLPNSIKYLKERIITQLNRDIISSWIYMISDSEWVLGVPFDFDKKIITKMGRNTNELVKNGLLFRNGSPGLYELDKLFYSSYHHLTELNYDIVVNNIEYPLLSKYNIAPLLPEYLRFDIRVICKKYIETDIETLLKISVNRVHIIPIDPNTRSVLVCTFDDSRVNFMGGLRERKDVNVLCTIKREILEESNGLIKLTDDVLMKYARYYYCASNRHVVCEILASRFEEIKSHYKLGVYRGSVPSKDKMGLIKSKNVTTPMDMVKRGGVPETRGVPETTVTETLDVMETTVTEVLSVPETLDVTKTSKDCYSLKQFVENFGFKIIPYDVFINLYPGCLGPNIMMFYQWYVCNNKDVMSLERPIVTI